MSSAVEANPFRPVSRQRWTYDELIAEMPETNQPHELWDGELIMAPSPFFNHQKIVLRLYRQLDDWVTAGNLGEVIASPIDMVLAPHRVVQPDVAYISRERLGIIDNVIKGAADLAAEVISPGCRQRDRIEKKNLYEQFGVKEYWLVDPDAHTIEILGLAESKYTLTMRCGPGQHASSRLLPGFRIAVDELFHGT